MAAYGTDAGFDTWLAEQGYTLASGLSNTVLRVRGSAYIDGYEAYWSGYRTDGVLQELGWPRTAATINCVTAVPTDAIPVAIVNAAYRAAWLEDQTPGVLAGATAGPGKRIKRQKVDSLEREFFDDGKASVGDGPTFIDSIIDGMISLDRDWETSTFFSCS